MLQPSSDPPTMSPTVQNGDHASSDVAAEKNATRADVAGHRDLPAGGQRGDTETTTLSSGGDGPRAAPSPALGGGVAEFSVRR